MGPLAILPAHWRALAGALCLILATIAGPARAQTVEEEMSAELRVMGDEVTERMIYGIENENLVGRALQNAINAWGLHYARTNGITPRERALLAQYVMIHVLEHVEAQRKAR